ncbi:MAG TPA: DUF3179 domain-containing (seleno)protein [Flavobacteriales bacterium]|nr:DUF3179 domain-containing (seleno)protein [Flavobacteriales bacterium]
MLAGEFFKAWLLAPAPGSQQSVAVEWSYFFHNYIWFFRIGGLLLMLPFFMYVYPKKRWWSKILFFLPFLLYGFVYYEGNYDMFAEEMFSNMDNKQMKDTKSNAVLHTKLVLGVEINGETRAYPVEIIGYHHQVYDTVGGWPVIITYCTVCRSGRVYKNPLYNGKPEKFRLVGMDMFNAMFEDESTGSWWQQATGECIIGPRKGQRLTEVFSQQMSLAQWLSEHPNTLVLQPDKNFQADYDDLKGFDEGTIKSSLEGRNFASWQFKSWIVGVLADGKSYAVDWNNLQKKKFIKHDDFIVVALDDGVNFKAFSTLIFGLDLGRNIITPPVKTDLSWDQKTNQFTDEKSGARFNLIGTCLDSLCQSNLRQLPAYQEFYHSWTTFHPGTIEVR